MTSATESTRGACVGCTYANECMYVDGCMYLVEGDAAYFESEHAVEDWLPPRKPREERGAR